MSKLGRYTEAFEEFDKAIELNPKKSTHWNNKGFCLNEQGRYEEAILLFDKAIECNPSIANSYCHKGYALYKLGNIDAAMDLYAKALEIRSDYELALERVEELKSNKIVL